MVAQEKPVPETLECCPEFPQHSICDTLNFRYRLPIRAPIEGDRRTVRAEIVLHFRLERCSEGIVTGDPIYSITLLPGEKVRLFTSDRHTEWSYDSESSLAYRHKATSVESFYTAAMSRAMSDLTITESGKFESSYEEDWAEGGGGASLSLFGIEIGGGGGGGYYDAESVYEFSRSLSRHAEAASSNVAAGVRARSATSIGEVERRTHAEGETEDHFESSTRVFSNANKCHAVTYLFYKLNKLQKVRFRLVAVERRIDDPATPTGAFQRIPVDTTGGLRIRREVVRANSKDRLNVENIARTSVAERLRAALNPEFVSQRGFSAVEARTVTAAARNEAIGEDDRVAALRALDAKLQKADLIDEAGHPSKKLVVELSWERQEVLPVPGVLVKGCLDECDACETSLMKEIEIDLEHKRLENELLKRQIELLEQSQEYRCCPSGEVKDDD